MPADPHQPFPTERGSERTSIHKCIVCLDAVVDAEEFFANDHAHSECADRDVTPLAGGGQPSGFRPIDREEVRDEIARRG